MAALVVTGIDAQNDEKLTQDVEVIRAYTPTISDAFKLSELPLIKDSVTIESKFQYAIETKQLPTDFQIDPIKPATMLGEPLSRLYNSYAKIGFGNYVTPMAELYINNLRSKKYTWNAFLKHQSSFGTIKNEDQKKVYAGYVDDFVSLSGKKFIDKKTLYCNIDYRDNTTFFYGYNAQDTNITTPPTAKGDLKKQQFMLANALMGIKTNYTDKSHLNYDIFANYYYFQDFYKNMENHASLTANLSKYYNKELLGLDFSTHFNQKSFTDSTNALIKLNPWVSRVTDLWEVRIGLSAMIDIYWKEKFHFYPDVYLQYAVYKKLIIPYFGLKGYVEQNTYRNTGFENYFIAPGLDMINTNHRKVIYGGIKGTITSNTFYNVKAMYTELQNAGFYVNDTTMYNAQRLQNKFLVTTSNAQLVTIFGEASVRASEKLHFRLKGNYNHYIEIKNEDKAWHIPEYQGSVGASYNLQNKIYVSADVFVIGERYAKTYDFTQLVDGKRPVVAKKLNMVVDANIGVEYRYNKAFSLFLNFNNIANQKYYRWNNYQMQGFNFMGGLTYSF
ncbi:MAG: hypothetical protein A2275_18075 [Bacteroidetes bacterium RIFOXYA12_FULL_35_11]|nr:MAG: hypothetical protein A2X01_07860 [Bacteroidetes bacterium GWF2_35_48]OFY73023.1 MAG: hypothetical protein A2275_18075 [Bacteroidetes bacterium RIFOXYA12_FULL_35_11]OFY93283.1 MAG: hypothetical protein A2309_09070 [Bacteroidetes bacterium RIFOXYB2_FULL_35_7]OFY96488.1 MAG: hypothetical protein A2491_19485 [Bacteroidetes bacterium RIFOXYC12_FULL_35_7]HBX50406.1 hypothetical protein [Bacteroidales bacterium]